jgi:hypothetical protein
MRLEYQVVHLVDGRLFDAESYELTSRGVILTQREGGYYLALRTSHGQEWRDDATDGFVGPFASAQHATLAIRDLRLPSGAIECGPEGLMAAVTVPLEKVEVS